jgi:uncharacterized protein with FMN-binding domain
MPRRGAIALTITGLALVLLLSFKTPDAPALAGSGTAVASGGAALTAPPASATPSAGQADPTPSAGATGGTSATPGPAASQPTTGPYVDGTVSGTTASTRFGPVQVAVTIAGGRIVDVAALQLPVGDRRSVQISQYAAAVLREEALQAQSANLDLVSGATYTSDAYVRSLQSALDQARA